MAMNIKQEEINILDSRFRKNDNKKESSLGDTPSVSSLSGDTPSLSSLGDTPSLSSLGKSCRDATRGSINNDIITLDSRVFANATHKNDRKRNADAVHKNDSRMSESGRSMVEMLGTLAIIGVLSVGAIAGYSYGMDKYRANTIMNDVMLRAVDVIAQFDRTGDANLDGWPTTTAGGYTIGLENETIGIQVDNVPERICEMIVERMEHSIANIKINAKYAGENIGKCGNDNTLVFYFYPMGCFFDSDCNKNEVCKWNQCLSFDKPIEIMPELGVSCTSDLECQAEYTGASCSICMNKQCVVNPDVIGRSCLLNNGINGQCNSGQCVPKECSDTNNTCQQGYYCASPNNSCLQAFQENETGSCVKPVFNPYNINGSVYYMSQDTMSWWDAEASCKAAGFDGVMDVNELLQIADELYKKAFNNTGKWYIWTSQVRSNCHNSVLEFPGKAIRNADRSINYRFHLNGTYVVCK